MKKEEFENELLDKAFGKALRGILDSKIWKDLFTSVKGIISVIIVIITYFISLIGPIKLELNPYIFIIILLTINSVLLVFFYSFVKVIGLAASDLHLQECKDCNIVKEKQNQEKELKEISKQLDSATSDFQLLLKELALTIHDIIHKIRDSLNPSEINFNFPKEVTHILDMCKKFFNHKYPTKETFTVSLMEVDNLENPQYMMTTYYSNGTLEKRKKWRSIVRSGRGKVAGKFLKIQELKNKAIEPDDELEPIIWTKPDLALHSFIAAGSKKEVSDSKKTNRIKRDKDYYYGISSPFLVKGRLQGCINIDIPEVSNFKGFSEEDKEIIKFFGDMCALLYHLDAIVKECELYKKQIDECGKLYENLTKAKEKITKIIDLSEGKSNEKTFL